MFLEDGHDFGWMYWATYRLTWFSHRLYSENLKRFCYQKRETVILSMGNINEWCVTILIKKNNVTMYVIKMKIGTAVRDDSEVIPAFGNFHIVSYSQSLTSFWSISSVRIDFWSPQSHLDKYICSNCYVVKKFKKQVFIWSTKWILKKKLILICLVLEFLKGYLGKGRHVNR